MDAADGPAAQAGLRTALADALRQRDQVAVSALRSASGWAPPMRMTSAASPARRSGCAPKPMCSGG